MRRFAAFLFLTAGALNAVPPQMARERQSVQNFESELSYLKQKVDNQEDRIESLREEIAKLVKATKELTASQASSTDAKVQKVEKNLEKLVSDMKQFKTHANESNELIKELQKAVAQAQANGELHSRQVEGLETALKSLTKAMQADVKSSNQSRSCYRVKKGDTLEKIAKEFQTTASAIKELNGLSSNTIRLDQELKIP